MLALVVGILFSTARGGNLINSTRLRSTDFLHGDTSPGDQIIIVAIDDASVAQYGSWPWPHDIHAQLIEKLYQARVTGFDILFDEVGDPEFLDDISVADNIVLAKVGVFSETALPGIISPQAVLAPPNPLILSAEGTGLVNALPDTDGVIRRIPLLVQGKDQIEVTMGIEMLRCCLYSTSDKPEMTIDGYVLLNQLQIPVDKWGRMAINFVGEPETFPSVSYVDVISGNISPDTFEDKIVFVGQMNLTGGGDLHDVPTSRGKSKMAGVEIQANIIHTLLHQRFLVEQSLVSDIAIILLMSLMGGWIVFQVRFGWRIPFMLSVEGAFLLYAFSIFDLGIIPDIFYPSLSLGVSYIIAVGVDNINLFRNLQKKHTELIHAYDTTLQGWAIALELRDNDTKGHTMRVTELTVQLAEEMGINVDELIHIRRGAILHDIGKIGIPDRILRKPGKLTDDEMNIIRQHPSFGQKIISPIKFLQPALPIIYSHHEMWDGTGYPLGLKGKNIPLAARIFSVVDVWDACTSDRPYRSAMSKEEVLTIISNDAGTRLDPDVVAAFMKFINKKL